MAKPSNPLDWQFIVSDQKEEIRTLKQEVASANHELTLSRREIERLKDMILRLEGDVADYRADVSKWRTLYEQGSSPSRPPVSNTDQQRQLNDLQRQLALVSKERDELKRIPSRQQSQSFHEERPDNPVLNAQMQNAQIESNRLRYTIQQKDTDIRKILQDLKDQRSDNDRLSLQLKSKEEEIDRLRQQLLNAPNMYFQPLPQPSAGETDKLKEENRRLSNDNLRLKGDIQSLQDRNIHLHQQNMMYEDDYKKEKEDRQLCERRLSAARDEARNLQAVIDAVNQGGGGVHGGGVQPP